jgi:hypothetical protein
MMEVALRDWAAQFRAERAAKPHEARTGHGAAYTTWAAVRMKLFGWRRQQDEEQASSYRYEQREIGALVGTAMFLAGRLEEIIAAHRHPTDLTALIAKLEDLAREARRTHTSKLQDPTAEQGSTTFDAAGHAQYIAPNAMLLTAPEMTTAQVAQAISEGATDTTIVHQFALAELEAALQRWRLAFHIQLTKEAAHR